MYQFKKSLLYILGGFLLFISIHTNHSSVYVDPRLSNHYKRFIDIAEKCEIKVNANEWRLEVDYKHKPNDYYAITIYDLNLISVNNSLYKRLSSIEKEQVILHELGHALLDLPHDDIDLNLMNTLGFINKGDYIQYYDYFIRKLFKPCRYKGEFKHE